MSNNIQTLTQSVNLAFENFSQKIQVFTSTENLLEDVTKFRQRISSAVANQDTLLNNQRQNFNSLKETYDELWATRTQAYENYNQFQLECASLLQAAKTQDDVNDLETAHTFSKQKLQELLDMEQAFQAKDNFIKSMRSAWIEALQQYGSLEYRTTDDLLNSQDPEIQSIAKNAQELLNIEEAKSRLNFPVINRPEVNPLFTVQEGTNIILAPNENLEISFPVLMSINALYANLRDAAKIQAFITDHQLSSESEEQLNDAISFALPDDDGQVEYDEEQFKNEVKNILNENVNI